MKKCNVSWGKKCLKYSMLVLNIKETYFWNLKSSRVKKWWLKIEFYKRDQTRNPSFLIATRQDPTLID